MDVRAQISNVFHLDKCIGCHTCSIACNNLWTSRDGTEYMWWNNVETKPGTGYPTQWENQEEYRGGWEVKGNSLKPRIGKKLGVLTNLFFNPHLPSLDDYYEPWTYDYKHLYNAAQADHQPIAKPVSKITGNDMNLEAGPNWDDDLSGSSVYARNDVNLAKLTEAEQQALFQIEQMVFFYVPRICNHCLNPACLAVCPSGAIYKRGEDGIVLINQDKCRGWRFCVSGCPYKKTYYNWKVGKSEKCILCYPRVETGQAPACFHSCVGRIRYSGVIFYDADRIEETAKAPEKDLVAAQRGIIMDPFDLKVIASAKKNGVSQDWINSAQNSPAYKFIKKWELALPLHAEFRTLPTLFYVPPLLPVIASTKGGNYDITGEEFFGSLETSRVPIKYMASLFSAGNESIIGDVLRKLWAVRSYQRAKSVGDLRLSDATETLASVGITASEADQITELTALARFEERFGLPPYHREQDIEQIEPDVIQHKYHVGIGNKRPPKRGP